MIFFCGFGVSNLFSEITSDFWPISAHVVLLVFFVFRSCYPGFPLFSNSGLTVFEFVFRVLPQRLGLSQLPDCFCSLFA